MKRIVSAFLIVITMVSCKKEAIISDTSASSDSTSLTNDSVSIKAAENPNAFRVNPIQGKKEKGKAVFSENGNPILVFDTQANSGIIKINDEEITLNKLIFSENSYEISGKNVSIVAEDGNFQDNLNDCNIGTFPEIKITYNNHTSTFKNIKVDDCPIY